MFWAVIAKSAVKMSLTAPRNDAVIPAARVAATALVTTCYRPNERGKAQALNDLLVFSTTATSSFMAGFLQDRWGWQPLNWFSVLLMLAAAAAVVWLRHQRASLSASH